MPGASRDVLIVGGGVAGLTCARELRRAGAGVLVLEKSRGVGGRCATRRIAGQPVDHGTALVHGDDVDLLAELERVDAPVLDGWPSRVVGGGAPCQPRTFSAGERRVAFAHGITAFPKHLARGTNVELGAAVAGLSHDGALLRANLADGRVLEAPTVVLTAPAPQTRKLLRSSTLDGERTAAMDYLLGTLASSRCLTLIAGYPPRVGEPPWHMAYPEDSGILQLISHDSSKRERPAATVLVAQGRPCWSRQQWDRPVERWRAAMLGEVGRLVGGWAMSPAWTQEHRWRFAQVGRGAPLTSPLLLELPGGARVGLCGEGFAAGGGVQAAWRAGRRMAERLGDGSRWTP